MTNDARITPLFKSMLMHGISKEQKLASAPQNATKGSAAIDERNL